MPSIDSIMFSNLTLPKVMLEGHRCIQVQPNGMLNSKDSVSEPVQKRLCGLIIENEKILK